MSAFTDKVATMLLPRLSAVGVPQSSAIAFVAAIDYETAGGTSKNVIERHNFGGIRGGTVSAQNTRGYRIYATDADGIDAYVALLVRSYGSVLSAARGGDPYATAVALGRSPWSGTGYRLNADGTNDKAVDAGAKLGTPGTEGQALFPRIRALSGLTPPTTAPTLTQARTSIVEVARSQIGTKEKPGNINPYAPAVGFPNGYAWCASFVTWCARQARIKLPVESPSTEAFFSKAKGDGSWRDLTVVAQPGWLVLFNDRKDPSRNVTHIGIVSADDGRSVTSIEGNTPLGGGADGVYEKHHTRSSGYIVGFVRLTNDNLLDGTTTPSGDAASGNKTALLTGSVVPPSWSAPPIADNEAGFSKAYADLLSDIGIDGIEGRAPRIHVDLSMEQTSEVTVSIDDPDLVLFNSGRFIVATESASGTPGEGTTWTWGKGITGQGWTFSLAVLELTGGRTGRGGMNLTFRSAAVQRHKQTRPPLGKTWANRSPSSVIAEWFERGHYVQDTKVRNTVELIGAAGATSQQARGESEREAAQRWAEQEGFVLFESGGAGYFAQPSWLVSGAGLPMWPLAWKGADTDDGIISIPSVRHTADDFRQPITVSVQVLATLGMRIHPGSTIALSGLGTFDAVYLVTGSSGDMAPDAVWTITATTPTNPTINPSATSTNSTDLFTEEGA